MHQWRGKMTAKTMDGQYQTNKFSLQKVPIATSPDLNSLYFLLRLIIIMIDVQSSVIIQSLVLILFLKCYSQFSVTYILKVLIFFTNISLLVCIPATNILQFYYVF